MNSAFSVSEKSEISFVIDPTRIIPGVELVSVKKYLQIIGRPCSENALEFCKKNHDAFEENRALGISNLEVLFNLEYFNINSTRCLFSLLKKEGVDESRKMNMEVDWLCEHEDMDMPGIREDLNGFFGFKSRIVPVDMI